MSKVLKIMGIFMGAVAVPSNAMAFDLGLIAVPDYLDTPIFLSALMTVMSFMTLKKMLPTGLTYSEVAEDRRTRAMTWAAHVSAATLLWTVALVLLGLVMNAAF